MRKLSLIFLLLLVAGCGSSGRYSSPSFSHKDPVASNTNLTNYQKAMSLKNRWGNIDDEYKRAFYSYLNAANLEGDESAKLEMAKLYEKGMRIWRRSTKEQLVNKDPAKAQQLYSEIIINGKTQANVCPSIKGISSNWDMKKTISQQQAFNFYKQSQKMKCEEIIDQKFDYLTGPFKLYYDKTPKSLSSKMGLHELLDTYGQLALNKKLPKAHAKQVYIRWEFLVNNAIELAKFHAEQKKNSRFDHFSQLANSLIRKFPYQSGKNIDQNNRTYITFEATKDLGDVFLTRARNLPKKEKVDWYNRAYNNYRSALNSANRFSKDARTSAQAPLRMNLCNIQYEILTVAGSKKYVDNAIIDCNIKSGGLYSKLSSYDQKRSQGFYYRFLAEKISISDNGLPVKIKKDKYMLKAADFLKQNKYGEAYPYLFTLVNLEKKKKIRLPHSTIYYYADTCYQLGLKEEAKNYINVYFKRTGRKGRYYRDALNLHSKI